MSTSSRRRLAREEGRVLRVATYRRISTNEVNQPHSLEAQERSLKDYIAVHPELVFTCDYADQQTGTNNHRPGLETMLDDAATGAFDVVLFYRLDRLARSVYGFMDITNRLEAANVAVRSATEPFETMTPAGKLMAQMLASFAEFEHSILIDRILEAFETKAMKGEWLGGRAPYGYLNNKEDKSLTVQPEEAAVVRRVFSAYQTGKGAKTIAEELNRAGVTHRGGKKWYPEAVLRLLEGAVYAGLIAHGDERYPGLHEAIVSTDEMAAVAAIRSTRNRRERATRPAMGLTDYILTGVTRCGECGGSMVGTGAHGQGGSYRYYTCNLQTKRAESERCRNERVAADELEDMVTQAVLNAYQDTELFELAVSMATAQTPHQAAELDEQASSVRAAIATSQAALERYFDAFEEGALDAVSMQKRVEALETRLTAQRAELARLIEAAAELHAGGGTLVDLSAALDQVTQALSAKDGYHEKKRILGALVESVTVSKGRNVDVVLRVPTVNSSGPGQVLPGGRTRRAATHARRRQRDVESSEGGYRDPLVRRESALEWTPVRTGSHMVEVLGIEPRSVSFVVNILRAQLLRNCRGTHRQEHRSEPVAN